MRLDQQVIILLFLSVITASIVCAGEAGMIEIYKSDGSLQCESDSGISLESMAQELIENGIKVHGMKKSHDGRERIALCGAATGSINVYEIAETELPDALDLKFQHMDTLFSGMK